MVDVGFESCARPIFYACKSRREASRTKGRPSFLRFFRYCATFFGNSLSQRVPLNLEMFSALIRKIIPQKMGIP